MDDKDGGPAFPQVHIKKIDGVTSLYHEGGLTKREWFAGQAMASVRISDWTSPKDAADWCWAFADAVLAAGRRKP